MIYTSIRYLRMGLVLIGFLLLIGSVFLPFQTHCKWNSTESGTIGYWVYSYESVAYWGRLFFVLIIFLWGYFRRDIVYKALLYTFSSLFLLFLFFSVPFMGNPCVPQSEIGQVLSLTGSLMVPVATFISIYREEE